MNKFQAALMGLLAVSISGCVVNSPTVDSSYESYDKGYAPQMTKLASDVASEIVSQYPNKLVFVDATHKEGSFADLLRRSLANRNALAVTPPMSDVKVRYAIEELEQGLGYLNMRFDDGSAKTKTFFLIPPNTYSLAAHTEQIPLSTPMPSDYYEKSKVEEHPLSASESEKTMPLEEAKKEPLKQEKASGEVAAALQEAAAEAKKKDLPATHTVKKGECPYTIAKKYNVPLEDFFAVNGGRKRCALLMPGQVMLLPGSAKSSSFASNSESKNAAPAASPVTVAAAAKTDSPAPVPAPVPTQIIAEKGIVETWSITPGSIRNQLQAWAGKAGYQLVWDADTDLDMRVSSTFYGDFSSAVSQLFGGLHEAGFPLTATIYQGNNVLEVGDK